MFIILKECAAFFDEKSNSPSDVEAVLAEVEENIKDQKKGGVSGDVRVKITDYPIAVLLKIMPRQSLKAEFVLKIRSFVVISSLLVVQKFEDQDLSLGSIPPACRVGRQILTDPDAEKLFQRSPDDLVHFYQWLVAEEKEAN